jgi:uncharacterized membrane-anchored protein
VGDDATLQTPAQPRAARSPLALALALGLQLLFVGGLAAPQIRAAAVGTPVRLAAEPVDPYDLMRGRYMRLHQPDLTAEALARLPGAPAAGLGEAATLWVELAPGQGGAPWRPVAVGLARPAERPGHVLLRGERKAGELAWGLERYYIPESRGDTIERAMTVAHEASRPIAVEAKVGPDGTAKVEALWIDGKAY